MLVIPNVNQKKPILFKEAVSLSENDISCD